MLTKQARFSFRQILPLAPKYRWKIRAIAYHGHLLRLCNGRLYAKELFSQHGKHGETWVDVSDMRYADIMQWLGY